MAKKRTAKKSSRKTVESMATRVGAKVSTSSGEFNTNRNKSLPMLRRRPETVVPKPEPKPEPAPKAPEPVLANQPEVVAAIENASADMKTLFLDLVQQMDEIKRELANRPTEWVFDWEYHRNGDTKRIRAHVPNNEKQLH